MVTDAWNHAFAEAQHIATVHARYGKNHLESEISTAANDTNSKNAGSLKASESPYFHILENLDYQLNRYYCLNNNLMLFQPQKLPLITALILAPPPRIFTAI